MPVVMFDRITDDIQCDKVIIDDELAAFEAVQSLINKGRKLDYRNWRWFNDWRIKNRGVRIQKWT